MRTRVLASLLLATAAGLATLPALDPASPEFVVAAPVEALRTNDILALFKSMPEADQAKAKTEWTDKAAAMSPTERAEVDEKLALLLSPGAVDTLMAIVEPNLKQINPQEAAGMLQMFGGMAAMQLAQEPSMAVAGQNLQKLVMDLATWLPTSGIEDPVKMRQAIGSVVDAAKALGVATSDELFALDLETFLTRGGAAVKEAKKTLAPYGIDVDAFLASISLVNVKGEGDKRTGDLKFTAFAHDYLFPMPLVKKDGKWVFDEQELQQSLAPMMGGMMGGGGGAGEL
jgi:hypothetical protein